MSRANRIRSREAGLHLAVALTAGLLFASPVEAEIFRCVGPDGSVIYTSDERQCPGARPHEPKGVVQTVPGRSDLRTPPAASVRRSMTGSGDVEVADGLETMWRKKRTRAEQEHREVESALRQLESINSECNRGAKWTVKDKAGLRKQVTCEELGGHLRRAQSREQELRAYLDRGLEEDCRRSGCLPGWVR